MYTYRATIIRVVDGDTVIVDMDLGFYITVRQSCRLAGLNTRELHNEGGWEAAAYLRNALSELTGHVLVTSVKADKYAGRFDGIIWKDTAFEHSINQQMIDDGYAAIWDGTGPKPVPPLPYPRLPGR